VKTKYDYVAFVTIVFKISGLGIGDGGMLVWLGCNTQEIIYS
jgi:hypothetical protein